MNFNLNISAFFYAVMVFISIQGVYAETSYEAVCFGDFNSKDYFEGTATAINENNEIVGFFYHADNRYLFTGNARGETSIIYRADFCYPKAINDRGDIVGSLLEKSDKKNEYQESCFLWLSEERILKKYPWRNCLPVSSSLNGITNDRIIVATLGRGNGFHGRGVIFKDSCYNKIFEINKENHSFRHKFTSFSVCDINNTGYAILNCSSFPVASGLPQKTPPSTYIIDVSSMHISYIGEGYSIQLNDNMDVLCNIKNNGIKGYYIWSEGHLIAIEKMIPTSLNNYREVVGRDEIGQAVIWKNGIVTKIIDLVDPQKLNLLRIEDASGINDQGAIACTGVVESNEKEKRVPLLLIPNF